MRKAAYVFLVIFLIAATLGVFSLITALRGVQEGVTNPIGDLVRDLVIEATPVILPNPVVVVREINDLARLETASYTFQDVIEIERNQEMLFGAFGETLLFVAYGEVIAGVDLAQMQPEDLQVVSPTTVMIHLPEAEVFFSRLDNEQSYVANRDIGVFTDADPQLETLVRQEAERRIMEAALEAGILDRANENAEAYMREFLLNLGFEEVIFTDTTPPPVTPYVQEVPKGYAVTPVPTQTAPPQ
ncbi:MAG: DUF4230 domain-containing protein [Chloroflexi bacterium]|nr:DUF4230 domain-containing protein [Chloroflexota bacterium]MCI0648415.1 DUF4230 domain-containing protein [Chloroflexota bacterium]MCI0727651.1 DUF4230 domain-containing protein [Chloroflexota bacterium]